MTITVTYTRSYTTDDVDPILNQDDDSLAEWFCGVPLHQLLMAEGFGFTLEKEP